MSQSSSVNPPLGPSHEVDDGDVSKVFETTKHDILYKLWELHKEDNRHHLNEVRKLDHIKFYRPLTYRTQEVPFGVNYFGKILLDEHGSCVHVRVLKSDEGTVKFHSLHNRAMEGGALFGEEDEIEYFEY